MRSGNSRLLADAAQRIGVRIKAVISSGACMRMAATTHDAMKCNEGTSIALFVPLCGARVPICRVASGLSGRRNASHFDGRAYLVVGGQDNGVAGGKRGGRARMSDVRSPRPNEGSNVTYARNLCRWR